MLENDLTLAAMAEALAKSADYRVLRRLVPRVTFTPSVGHTTAASAAWTPRLVHFLLALMFNDPKNDKKPEVGTAKPAGPAPARMAQVRAPKISMDDKDQLARLLSSLGRVTVKH